MAFVDNISIICYYCAMPPAAPPPQEKPAQALKPVWYRRLLVHIVAMVLVPPVGLLAMWLFAPWKKHIKLLLTIPLLFTSAVFILSSILIFQEIGRQSAVLGEEKIRIERFLQQKYSKQFTVKSGKIAIGGDVLFGVNFKTYQAQVSPVDDPATVFTASRIVSGQSLDGGANDPDKLNYFDEYLQVLWAKELRGELEKAVHKESTDVFAISYHVSLMANRQSRAEFYDAIWGTVPKYKDLSLEQKKKIAHVADIKSQGTVDSSNIVSHANTMLAVKSGIDPNKEVKDIVVIYKVYHDKSDKNPGWQWQNSTQVEFENVSNADEIIPYFIEWREGRGLYYNPKTKQFDLTNPLSASS